MKSFAVPVLGILLAATVPPAVRAQFLPGEIAQRPAHEEFLRTAEIVRFEEIGEGVTKPYKLYLRKDGVELKAAWKNPQGLQLGFLEGWQYEIAAYRLDKLIGLNMVPPAVEREFQGQPGALVLWARTSTACSRSWSRASASPTSAKDHTEKMKWLTRAWDSLIANEDRTQQNILYTEDWRVILFDHSRAFRSEGEFAKRLMFGRDGIQKAANGNPFLFRRVPSWFVERIKTLTYRRDPGGRRNDPHR